MIDTDETGQKKLQEIVNALEDDFWSEWEQDFIFSNRKSLYKNLTSHQKTTIGTLYEKLQRQ